MTFIKKLVYNSENPYNGVFNFIKKITNHDDIHSSNDVHISVSSNSTSERSITWPLGINNYDASKYWASNNKENSWYQVDLRNFLVKVDSYVYAAKDFDFFEKWELWGANDPYNWVTLSTHKMSDAYAINDTMHKHFIANQNPDKYNLLRIYTYGKRTEGNSAHLCIFGLEFYGTLYSKYCPTLFRKNKIYLNQLLLLCLIII